MTIQNGIGVITKKGQEILTYIDSVGGTLSFQKFVLSSLQENIIDIVNDEYTQINDKTYTQLVSYLGTDLVTTGTVDQGAADSSIPTTLPLLLSVPLGDIILEKSIHTVFITAIDPSDSTEYVFYQGCIYFDDNGTVGDYSDDGVTIPFVYVPGTNLLLRVNLEYTSGFPASITFNNTQVTEIQVHDALPSAHNTTHLRIDGGNSPTTDIDFDNNKIINLGVPSDEGDAIPHGFLTTYEDKTGADKYNLSDIDITLYGMTSITGIPSIINHSIYILVDDDASLNGETLYLENFSGNGLITIASDKTNSNLLKKIHLNNVQCNVYINDVKLDANSGYGFQIDNCKYVTASDCEIINAGGISKAIGNTFFYISNLTIGSGNINGFWSTEGALTYVDGIVQSIGNKLTGSSSSNYAYKADYSGRIHKYCSSTAGYILCTTSGSSYEINNGGVITGYNTTATISIDSTNIAYINYIINSLDKNLSATITFMVDSAGLTTPLLNINNFNGSGKIVIQGNAAPSDYSDAATYTTTLEFTLNSKVLNIFDNEIYIEFKNILFGNFYASGSISDSMFYINNCRNINFSNCYAAFTTYLYDEIIYIYKSNFISFDHFAILSDSTVATISESRVSFLTCADGPGVSRTYKYVVDNATVAVYDVTFDGSNTNLIPWVYVT